MESKSFPSNFDIAGRYAKPGQTFLITVELKKNYEQIIKSIVEYIFIDIYYHVSFYLKLKIWYSASFSWGNIRNYHYPGCHNDNYFICDESDWLVKREMVYKKINFLCFNSTNSIYRYNDYCYNLPIE